MMELALRAHLNLRKSSVPQLEENVVSMIALLATFLAQSSRTGPKGFVIRGMKSACNIWHARI